MTRRTSITGLTLAAVLVALTAALVALSGGAPAHKSGHHHKHHGHHHHKHSKPPKPFYGVDPQTPVDATDLQKMKANGITVLRSPIYWQSIQPNNANEFHFTGFDNLVRAAADQGITVLPYIYGTPDWVAHNLDHRSQCGSECQLYAPRSKQALSALTDLTRAAAARYGPNGSLWQDNPAVPKKPIHTWQIWNEQNSKTFYLPKPSPANFAKLLAAARKGIHSQDHKAKIVLGGMFGLPKKHPNPGKAMPASTFVHDLLKHKGAKHDFDGVAVHPYSPTMKFIKKQASVMHKELRKSHDSGASMWITETGAASSGPKSSLNLGSEKAQAKRVTDTYELFSRHRKDWNVKLVAWFSWQDVPGYQGNCFFCGETGLVDGDGKAKLSLHAYKRAAK